MIIGRYAVAPTHVAYGYKRFDPDAKCTEVTIILDDETELSQWMDNEKEITKAMKSIDECIVLAEAEEREYRDRSDDD